MYDRWGERKRKGNLIRIFSSISFQFQFGITLPTYTLFLTPACDTNGHSFGATLASGGHKAWLADSNYTVNFDMGTTTQAMWSSGTGINAYWADTTEIWAKSIRFLKVTEDLTKLSLLIRRTVSRHPHYLPAFLCPRFPSCYVALAIFFLNKQ